MSDTVFHSGFACFVGRPNAGKSTLTNALVGTKVAIASDKPQTTRHIIRGILTRDDGQLVILDTPGIHRPRTLLGTRLNQLVYDTWTEVDVIGVCLPCPDKIGPGDRHLLTQISQLSPTPTLFALATKMDIAGQKRTREHLIEIQQLESELGFQWEHIIPVSALTGENLDKVSDLLLGSLPQGPAFYPEGEVTDEPTQTLVAELIREVALTFVQQELPHSLTVTVEEMQNREGREKPLLDIYANLVVERDSQKPIILGKKAERLRAIGTEARRRISALLGVQVHLDLRVTVVKDWQRDPKALRRLGF
ncbi:MAG: GTPase Era [Propionibacteriaceae bacterium]|jgi:GTP-binding protein Era|nr:GTPase Era [Propionibacteriaceae bacterium]